MMWRHRALVLACCLMAMPAAALDVIPGPPDGFASLETPRSTFIAVSYGGESIGSFPARYTPTSVVFDAPDMLIASIPGVADEATLRHILSLPLPTNAGKRCQRELGEKCEPLKPDTAAIIFDAQNLSAELFINPKLLATQDSSEPRYLPLPKRDLSSVYGFSGAIAGTSNMSPNYSLNNQSVFAYGEARINTATSFTDRGARIDTADASIDRNGWAAQGGLFRSRSMQLIPDHDMAGVDVGTSLRTRVDTHKLEGNEIILYLPRRAIVSIYRDGKLYASHPYEAGNQKIDTNELPEGAYTITLHIQEEDGTARDEQRFFAKSPDLPPPGDPTYYVQAGLLRAEASVDKLVPQVSSEPILRFGSIRRVGADLGFTSDLIWVDDRAAAELGGFYYNSGLQLRTTGMLSSRGDSGTQFSALYNNDRWALTVDTRAVWADRANVVTSSNGTLIDDEGHLIRPLQQSTISASYAVTPDLNVGLRASHSKQDGISQTAYGPNLTWYLYREAESLLSFQADGGSNNDRAVANAFLRFTMRFGDFGISTTGGYTTDTGVQANARVFQDTRDADGARILGATLQHDSDITAASIDGDWRNSMGRAQGLLQESTGKHGTFTSYNSNFTVNMAQLDDDLYLGGNESDLSAVVVDLTGDDDVPMTIYVGSRAYGELRTGHSRTIYLPPYQRYRISVKPSQRGLISYSNQARDVTLYPGNVVRLHWDVNHFYVVVASLVTPEGVPLADAALQEDGGHTSTNANGRLQIQLTQPGRLTFITPELTACEAVLPPMKPVNGVLLYRTPLVCQPIATD